MHNRDYKRTDNSFYEEKLFQSLDQANLGYNFLSIKS